MGSRPPPEQEPEEPNRYVPPELIEQILSNLPLTSLPRFSCVSTPWNSIIAAPHFAAKHGGGKKILVINDHPSYFDVRAAFRISLSAVEDAAASSSLKLVCKIRGNVKLKAFTEDLWCVEAKKSLYLWNPTTGSRKKLLHAPPPLMPATKKKVVYGLGYDAVEDDYKLMKISNPEDSFGHEKSWLYSLKNDSWREIGSKFLGHLPKSNGLFVNGALHWMVKGSINNNGQSPFYSSIVSFDFSTEDYKFVHQPNYCSEPDLETDLVDVAVLRSKLCVFVNYRRSYCNSAFVLWAMEDYGVVGSWTKLYEIDYKSIPPVAPEYERGVWFSMRPLYVYEDGRVVVWASSGYKNWDIIVYKDGRVVAHSKIVAPRGNKALRDRGNPKSMVHGGFVYVESIVSQKLMMMTMAKR